MKRKSKVKKLFISLVALVLVGAIGVGAYMYVGQTNAEPVNVFPFMYVGMTEYWGDSQESYGFVETDKIQTVYVSDTQSVTEILVNMGDTVKKGDVLMTFDTTLSDLALERERLNVEKLKLQLQDARNRLYEINCMKPMVIPQPSEDEDEDLGELLKEAYRISHNSDYDGSTAELALICWLNGATPISGPMLDELLLKAEEYQIINWEKEQEKEEEKKPSSASAVTTEPPATEPPATEPPATEPPETEPPTTEPPATEPPTTEPPATEPPETEPPTTEPPATEPPETEPPTTEPPATEPPATEPPATEPPATEPPATEPPATEPPATEPPATEPPATEPPATEPPATEPPETEPPETEPPETEPEKPVEVNGFYVVFKVTEGNKSLAAKTTWQGIYVILDRETGAYSFKFFDASLVPDHMLSPDEESEEKPEIDYGSGFTASQIAQMRSEQEKAIKELEFNIKMAEADYRIKQTEASDGKVYAQVDGTVVSLLSEEEARMMQQPVIKVSGGGGFYVEGTVSELDKATMQIGQEVTINDWNTGMVYTGSVQSIGDYPSADGYWTGIGNPNASYYPFRVFVDESADLEAGRYVNIQFSAGTTEHGVYLENPFIRTENGRSYVYVQGADGLLEQRFVTTGKSLWGSYTEILEGVTEEDLIAFPYGKHVKAGAETVESDISALYE